MNGLTATGVTVGICAGLWQLVSSHVGLSQGWELLGPRFYVSTSKSIIKALINMHSFEIQLSPIG